MFGKNKQQNGELTPEKKAEIIWDVFNVRKNNEKERSSFDYFPSLFYTSYGQPYFSSVIKVNEEKIEKLEKLAVYLQ